MDVTISTDEPQQETHEVTNNAPDLPNSQEDMSAHMEQLLVQAERALQETQPVKKCASK